MVRTRTPEILSTQAMRRLEEKNSTTSVIQAKFLTTGSESEVKNKWEREDHDDVLDQSDGAEESTPEMKIAEIDTLVSETYGCSNANYFSVLVAKSIVTIQHQVCEEKSRDKDILLLGMLAIEQHKEEIAHTRHSESATPHDCATLLYTVK